MDAPTPGPGADGLYHPHDEDDVAALVRRAAAEGRRLRVRGAGHAPPESVSGDRPGDLVVALDGLREVRVLDADARLVAVGAGIHLGNDPSAEGSQGALENSLLWQLAEHHGWTLSSTGGITHQTLGGYLATASAGGTLRHSMLDQVVTVRLVDGRGEVREFSGWEESPHAPGLAAVLPSLGLLGVITSVTLRCEPLFAITGQEAIVDLDDASIDITGCDPRRPSLQRFLTDAEYARIEWWPQRGAERLLVWQAQRIEPEPGFRARVYEEFTAYPIVAQTIISTLYVIFGNLREPDRAQRLLWRNAGHAEHLVERLAESDLLTSRSRRLGRAAPRIVRAAARVMPLLSHRRTMLYGSLDRLVPAILDIVLPLDRNRGGMRRDEPQTFRDWGWHGLPMDNQASDAMLASAFSELWVPLARAQQVIAILRAFFEAPAEARDAYHRTGLFAYELYGAPASAGWMHPGHSDGADEWRDGCLRFDVYWFTDNAEDPMTRFFPQFWELLREHEVPFRLHWGKEQPASSPQDRAWVDLFASRYPRWDDFLALRAELDPDEVFLTGYWRDRLGLWAD